MRRNSFHQAVRLSTLESAVCQGVWDILKCPCTLSTFPLLLGYKFPHFIVPLIPRPSGRVRPPVRSSHFLRRSESAKTSSLPTSPALTSVSLSLLALSADARALFPLPSPLLTSELPTRGSRLPTSLSLSLPLSLALPSSPIRCRFSDLRPPRPSSPERRR